MNMKKQAALKRAQIMSIFYEHGFCPVDQKELLKETIKKAGLDKTFKALTKVSKAK